MAIIDNNKFSNYSLEINFKRREQTYYTIREFAEWYTITLIPTLVIAILSFGSTHDLQLGTLLIGLSLIGTVLIFFSNITYVRQISLYKIRQKSRDKSDIYWTILEAAVFGLTIVLAISRLGVNTTNIMYALIIIFGLISNIIYLYIWYEQIKELRYNLFRIMRPELPKEVSNLLSEIFGADTIRTPLAVIIKTDLLLLVIIRLFISVLPFILIKLAL
jgi:hypothetical protein